MKRRHLKSLKTRMLIVNISFVLFAFAGAIGIFNVVMDTYISHTATQQLSTVVNYADASSSSSSSATSDSGDSSTGSTVLRSLNDAPRGIFNAHPSSFTVDNKYAVTTPTETSNLDQGIAKKIANALKAKSINLNNLHNYRFVVDNKTFYIESSKLESGETLIMYLDISGITNFSSMVNTILITVAAIVIVILSFAITLITGRMVKPLSDLAAFAGRIGKGDFTPLDERFDSQELATLATAMNTTASELNHSEQNQKMFFQNASHELRTPLMAIKSYAEGIKYDVMESKMAGEVIMTETDRMSELVEDLLTLSRLDNLNHEQETVLTDLRELVDDVVGEQAPIAMQKGVQIATILPGKAVKMDLNYKAMRRAISNLLSNALRYADKSVDLTIKQNKKVITLSVANDGAEIDAEELPHLFERFYKGRGGVHGIGLAMVKAIVDQHAGQITIERHDDKTYFIMRFDRQ